jgi:hypothetical protein
MGSFYRSQHELIFVWKSGTAPHLNNFKLGQYGRSRTNVWKHDGVNTMRPGRREQLAWHPTVKPAALVAGAPKDCSVAVGLSWTRSWAPARSSLPPSKLDVVRGGSKLIPAMSMSRSNAGNASQESLRYLPPPIAGSRYPSPQGGQRASSLGVT